MMRLKENLEARRHPTEEKRAGQGGKVLAVVICLKLGQIESVGSRNHRIGKNGQKALF